MSNAMEAGRQHVEQETPHELADIEAHDFALVITALAIVIPAETDVGLVEIEQAAVGDRDAMGMRKALAEKIKSIGRGLRAALPDLDRRTRHRAVGTEHAAIPWLRLEALPATLAVVKETAGVLGIRSVA